MNVTIARQGLYTLTESDAQAINRRREDARATRAT